MPKRPVTNLLSIPPRKKWISPFCTTAIIACGLLSSTAMATQPSLVQQGKKQFIRCAACHSLTAAEPAKLGPHLEGIVGRTVASVPGHDYSAALREQSFVWNEEQLDILLERPQQITPDLCMPFMGLSKPEARKALIEYLKNPEP